MIGQVQNRGLSATIAGQCIETIADSARGHGVRMAEAAT